MNRHFMMVRPDLENLPENSLPEEYRFEECTEDTACDYARIIDESFEQKHSSWFEQVTKKHGYFPGATVMIYRGDEAAATATALCDKSDGNTVGYLHMVGALGAHKGKRLGYESVLRCLHIMKQAGMKSCKLDTDDFRIPAVITYLKLGFMPAGLDEDYRVRWIKFLDETKYPDGSLRDYVRKSPMPVTLEWRFQTDAFGIGEERGMHRADYDDSLWKVVRFPIDADSVSDMNGHYEGVVWYRRSFDTAVLLGDDRLFFDFTGVNRACKVWINGRLCAESTHGYLSFSVEATKYLEPEGKNTLALMVDNSLSDATLPSRHIGWRNLGGITREVYLRSAPKVCVSSFEFSTDMSAVSYAALISGSDFPVSWTLKLEKDGVIAAEASGTATSELKGELKPESIMLWSPDSPELYDLSLTLENGHSVKKKVGFRKFESKNGRILLNGSPIKLFGVNRHEDAPDKWTSYAKKDLTKIKAQGFNFVRLCHYPHAPEIYDFCDELGLISWAEIPLYWNGAGETPEKQAEILNGAASFASRMVCSLKGNASVAFWCVSNETREDIPAVKKTNEELIRLVKKLIPGGFAVHVSDRWLKDTPETPFFEEDDIICVNGYPCVLWDRNGRAEPSPEKGESFWKNELPRLTAKYPGKPIIVSELGYPAIQGAHDQYWTQEEQARVIPAEARTVAACKNISGMAIWCWADHLWPDTLGLKLPTSPFGIVNRGRAPKKAAAVISGFASEYLGK